MAKSVISVLPKPFNKDICVPSSKSYSNRALILGAVSSDSVRINNLSESTDVLNMLRCFGQIGIKFEQHQNSIDITTSFPHCEEKSDRPIYLKTGDGGTTNRFLIPLLALGTNLYRIAASEKMAERPVDELIDSLRALGVSVKLGTNSDDFWLEVKGNGSLPSCSINVDCKRSTQFASGLLLAMTNTGVIVKATNVENSKKYFEMTQLLVGEYEEGKRTFDVPVDFSSLSYPLALAAVTGCTTILNYWGRDSYQPDSVLIDILQNSGATLCESNNSLSISKGELKAFCHDCSGCPDLTPTLAYLAAFSKGVSTLSGLEVLRFKESDRIIEIIKILDTYGVSYHYDHDRYILDIEGFSSGRNQLVDAHPPADHRIVMTHYLFMRTLCGGNIHNEHHVNKSFPHFFSSLG